MQLRAKITGLSSRTILKRHAFIEIERFKRTPSHIVWCCISTHTSHARTYSYLQTDVSKYYYAESKRDSDTTQLYPGAVKLLIRDIIFSSFGFLRAGGLQRALICESIVETVRLHRLEQDVTDFRKQKSFFHKTLPQAHKGIHVKISL